MVGQASNTTHTAHHTLHEQCRSPCRARHAASAHLPQTGVAIVTLLKAMRSLHMQGATLHLPQRRPYSHTSSIFAFTMHRWVGAPPSFPSAATQHQMVCQEIRTRMHASAVDSLVRVSRRAGGCPAYTEPPPCLLLDDPLKHRTLAMPLTIHRNHSPATETRHLSHGCHHSAQRSIQQHWPLMSATGDQPTLARNSPASGWTQPRQHAPPRGSFVCMGKGVATHGVSDDGQALSSPASPLARPAAHSHHHYAVSFIEAES